MKKVYIKYKVVIPEGFVSFLFLILTRKIKIPPLIYPYIQKEYWNVEIFDFTGQRSIVSLVYILPLMIVVVILYGNMKKKFGVSRKENFIINFFKILKFENIKSFEDVMIPHHFLFIILLMIGIMMVHFNTITRLISGYPFFYLFCGQCYLSLKSRFSKKLFIFWMVGYSIIACAFASNLYMPF